MKYFVQFEKHLIEITYIRGLNPSICAISLALFKLVRNNISNQTLNISAKKIREIAKQISANFEHVCRM